MNTKMLLTHFSTRYPHMPTYLLRPGSPARGRKSSSGKGPVMAPALDHARVSVGNMWSLRAIKQSFHEMFEEGDSEVSMSPCSSSFSFSSVLMFSWALTPVGTTFACTDRRHIKMNVVAGRDVIMVLVQHRTSLTVAYGHDANKRPRAISYHCT